VLENDSNSKNDSENKKGINPVAAVVAGSSREPGVTIAALLH